MHYNCNLFIVEVLHYYCSFFHFCICIYNNCIRFEIEEKYLREEFFIRRDG